MHLEEMFRRVGENRRELIAKRAAEVRFAGSAGGVFSPGEGEGEKSPKEAAEAVLTEVEVAAGRQAEEQNPEALPTDCPVVVVQDMLSTD